jgi:hypothetical protein
MIFIKGNIMYNTKIHNKKNIIVEDHAPEYHGYPFMSLIQYKQRSVISIIDNSDDKLVKAYVLDLCNSENVDEQLIILAANVWFENSIDRYPVSIEFAKHGLLSDTSKILKIFNIDMLDRIVGPVYFYPIDTVTYVKKRKRRILPASVLIS